MKRGLKQVLAAALTTGLAAAAMAVPFSSAAAATNADIEYHAPQLEPMVATLANSLLNDWPHMLKVSDAAPGVRYEWTNAGQNVRLGSPSLLKADGLHLIFDGFEPAPGMQANLALTLGTSAINSDYVTDVNGNTMAQLPFVLVIDTTNGNLTAYGSKTYTTANTEEIVTPLVQGNAALKADALRDKAWEVRLDAADAQTYTVTVNGVQATLPVDRIVGVGSNLDLDACAFVFNIWGSSNSFSINLRSLHGGEAACADLISDTELARATAVMEQIQAIGTIGPGSRGAVEAARTGYDALTAPLQTLVTNYETLTLAETVLPVVEAFGKLGNVTLESADDIEKAEELYATLTDEEKLLVSNYDTFSKAKTQLLRLQFAQGLTTTTAPPTRRPTSAPAEENPAGPVDEDPTEPNPTESSEAPEEPTSPQESITVTTQAAEPSEQPADAPPSDGNPAATIVVIVVGVILLAGMGAAAAIIGIRRKNAGGK